MLFTTQQIQNILQTVDMNTKFMAAKVLGQDILTDQDKKDLKSWGFDLKEIQNKYPSFLQSYHWGMLSQLLGDAHAKKITYNQFQDYLERGQYQPLTDIEKYAYEHAKKRTYGHIRNLGEGMKRDIANSIHKTEQEKRADYEKVIKEELEKGVVDRKSLQEIVSDLGHRTEDWGRNFGRIVDTEMNNIFQEGRAQQIKKQDGNDARVYKDVYPGACRHCISSYTTSGVGSKPRIFKLEELQANGSNVGKKVADWKPVIESHHPHCRCTLHKVIKGQVWNDETQSFEFPEIDKENKKDYNVKSKVRVTIGDKVYEV